jgi:hypothetical protein
MIQGNTGRYARAEDRGQHGDGHADHAVEVAAARGLGIGQPAEAEDEKDGCADVGDGGQAGGHRRLISCLFICGTCQHALGHGETAEHVDGRQYDAADRQPAIQLIGSAGRPPSGGAICTRAPMAMMLEMALVTLISGVCSAGVTFHTTM